MMGSPGRRSHVNKGVLFFTELIQAVRDRDDTEWQFTFVLQITTIFRFFPQLACLFWVKLTPSPSASLHTRSPRWHVCMFVGAPVCTADWQIGLLECEDLVNNDTFCSCRDKALQHKSPASGAIQTWDFWHRQTWRKSPVQDNAYTKCCMFHEKALFARIDWIHRHLYIKSSFSV